MRAVGSKKCPTNHSIGTSGLRLSRAPDIMDMYVDDTRVTGCNNIIAQQCVSYTELGIVVAQKSSSLALIVGKLRRQKL